MSLSILDFIFKFFGFGWELLTWLMDLSLRFFSAVINFGMKAAGAVFGLLMTPFTHGLGRLTDWTRLDLRGFFSLGMWVLLGACAAVALLAVGSNIYRRHRGKG